MGRIKGSRIAAGRAGQIVNTRHVISMLEKASLPSRVFSRNKRSPSQNELPAQAVRARAII
jgi:hypothetical protein